MLTNTTLLLIINDSSLNNLPINKLIKDNISDDIIIPNNYEQYSFYSNKFISLNINDSSLNEYVNTIDSLTIPSDINYEDYQRVKNNFIGNLKNIIINMITQPIEKYIKDMMKIFELINPEKIAKQKINEVDLNNYALKINEFGIKSSEIDSFIIEYNILIDKSKKYRNELSPQQITEVNIVIDNLTSLSIIMSKLENEKAPSTLYSDTVSNVSTLESNYSNYMTDYNSNIKGSDVSKSINSDKPYNSQIEYSSYNSQIEDSTYNSVVSNLSDNINTIISNTKTTIFNNPILCDAECKAGLDTRLLKEGFTNDRVKIPNIELINEQVLEEQNLAQRLYVLLYIWFFIAIFIFYVFVITMMSENGWNPLANYVLFIILLFSVYYIYKNIT